MRSGTPATATRTTRKLAGTGDRFGALNHRALRVLATRFVPFVTAVGRRTAAEQRLTREVQTTLPVDLHDL
ncbi:MAG: hypothetical protein ACYDG3_10735, partial [Bacillati bacterium]